MTLFRHRLTLVVLADRGIDEMEVGDVLRECDTGDMVLKSVELTTDMLTREGMDQELVEAGSDPSFFQEV